MNLVFKSLTLIFLVTLLFFGCSQVDKPIGDISGFVLDSTGKPITNALITIDSTSQVTQTGLTGAFFLTDLPFGPTQVTAGKTGFAPQTLSVNVLTNKTINQVNFSLTPQTFQIINIKTSALNATGLTITFNTTRPTRAVIKFGLDTLLGQKVEGDLSFASAHQIKLTNLTPQTTLFFQIEATDSDGFKQLSPITAITTLSTLEDLGPPDSPRELEAFFISAGQVKIAWSPVIEQDLSGYRVYRSLSKLGPFERLNNSLVGKGQENYTDAGLNPGQKYYYRVSSVDSSLNESGLSEIAEMVVPGELTSDITWTRGQSPFLLTGDLLIPENKIFILEAGIQVLIGSADLINLGSDSLRIEIINRGTFIAGGDASSPIQIKSFQGGVSRDAWGGISYEPGASLLSRLENIDLQNARYGIQSRNAPLSLRNSKIQLSTVGIDCQGGTGILIDNVSLSETTTGGIFDSVSSLTIQNSKSQNSMEAFLLNKITQGIFKENSIQDFSTRGMEILDGSGTTLIRNNTFSSLSGQGLLVTGGSPKINYNTIDVPRGITIQGGSPEIINCLIIGARSRGFSGIEFIASGALNPLPSFSDIFNFEFLLTGTATGTGVLHKDPLFVGGNPFSYLLQNSLFNDDIRRGSSENSQMGAFGGF